MGKKSKGKKNKPAWQLKMDSGEPSLDLSTFNFAGERVKKLAKRLAQNNTLTWLDMYRTRCGPKGATALGDALGKNHTLQHLLLRSNAVKSDGTLYLSKALANKSCALMTLDLSYNLVMDEGVEELGRALRGNGSLTTLLLAGNGVSDKGCAELTKPLRKNEALTLLDLSFNRIGGAEGNAGAESIADLIRENKCLTSLNLDTNKIGNEGAHVIASAIPADTRLNFLDISANGLKEDGADALTAAARSAKDMEVSAQDNNLPIKKF
jgi:Ran GTPase-activating protein (RanGAP) involved in mRNA processing and transport